MPQHNDVVVGRSYDDVPENAPSGVAFHRNAVPGDAFEKLAGGSKVCFAHGENGPQADAVHLVGNLNRKRVA